MPRHLTILILLSIMMSCESDHIFKDLENDKVVFIRLAKYGLDSIPPDIAKLKKVEELTISLDSSDGWTIYPPASAIVQMVDKPPFYQLPKQLTQLKAFLNTLH